MRFYKQELSWQSDQELPCEIYSHSALSKAKPHPVCCSVDYFIMQNIKKKLYFPNKKSVPFLKLAGHWGDLQFSVSKFSLTELLPCS